MTLPVYRQVCCCCLDRRAAAIRKAQRTRSRKFNPKECLLRMVIHLTPMLTDIA